MCICDQCWASYFQNVENTLHIVVVVTVIHLEDLQEECLTSII